MRVIGGSEVDAQARAAFRRRNGFEPMYENKTVTSDMLKGIYILVAGAPCGAYSLVGNRNGLSAKVGMHYIDQMDTYITAEIPVIILEQVPGAADIQPNDTVSLESGKSVQQIVEDKLQAAGYHVERKTCNATDYNGTVN
jgi:site-specific DNA-cytosine methylase